MTDAAQGKRRYRNLLSDIPDQVLFFGIFVVGAVSIWGLKFLGFSQIIVTVVPIFLMGAYATVALITKRYRIREDRVGDNIYYLGFLYTLTSLAYALFTYSPDEVGAATSIITSFGIAIFTTIVGLAGRIFFNQMREDPIEYEREARFSLAESSTALRTELAHITEEMAGFKRAIFQITQEGMASIAETANNGLVESVGKFDDAAKHVIERIGAAFASFTDHSTRLNDIAAQNVEALQKLFHRIENIEAGPDLLTAKIAPIIAKFEEVADEAARRNRNQTNDLKRLRDMLDTITAGTDMFRAAMVKTEAAVEAQLAVLVTGLERARMAAEATAEWLSAAGRGVGNEVDGIKRVSAELQSDIAAQGQSLSSARSAIESELRVIRESRTEMERMAAESRDAVRQLQSSLVSLTQTMVDQLGGPSHTAGQGTGQRT